MPTSTKAVKQKITKTAYEFKIHLDENSYMTVDVIAGSTKNVRKLLETSLAHQFLVKQILSYDLKPLTSSNQLGCTETSKFSNNSFYLTVKNIIMNLAFFSEATTLDKAIVIGNKLVTAKSFTIVDFAQYAMASNTLKGLFEDAVAFQNYK